LDFGLFGLFGLLGLLGLFGLSGLLGLSLIFDQVVIFRNMKVARFDRGLKDMRNLDIKDDEFHNTQESTLFIV